MSRDRVGVVVFACTLLEHQEGLRKRWLESVNGVHCLYEETNLDACGKEGAQRYVYLLLKWFVLCLSLCVSRKLMDTKTVCNKLFSL